MKKLYQVFRQSAKAILRNKGRSFLTTLGIIIGIGSVIALISLGNGVKITISSQINQLGTTNLVITPGQGFGNNNNNTNTSGSSGNRGFGGGGGRNDFVPAASTLTVNDLNSLSDRAKHPKIAAVSGTVNGTSIYNANGQDQRLTVNGVSSDYFAIRSLKINRGALLSARDVSASRPVAVLGDQFANEVLGGNDVVGRSITVNSQPYEVIGVLKTANENNFNNPNEQVYIPYTAAMKAFDVQNFTSLIAQADNERDVDSVKDDIQSTLLANHRISNPKLADFSVNTSKDLLAAVNNITSVLTGLLAGIAAISLVVGGIGIMNIMLVSVTERTREIGLRKAVGAQTRDILSQFIIEAVMLTLTGGLLGIGLGRLMGAVAARTLNFTPVVTGGAVLLAVGVSTAVGLVFGIYPAAKAARLNPIDALRYE